MRGGDVVVVGVHPLGDDLAATNDRQAVLELEPLGEAVDSGDAHQLHERLVGLEDDGVTGETASLVLGGVHACGDEAGGDERCLTNSH